MRSGGVHASLETLENTMKLISTTLCAVTLAALGGCAVYPAGPVYGSGYANEQVVGYPQGPVYYEPGPYYGSPPIYVNPIVVERDRDRWDRDHDRRPGARPPPRPPEGRPVPPPRPPAVRPGWRGDTDTGERGVRGDSSRQEGNSRFPNGDNRGGDRREPRPEDRRETR